MEKVDPRWCTLCYKRRQWNMMILPHDFSTTKIFSSKWNQPLLVPVFLSNICDALDSTHVILIHYLGKLFNGNICFKNRQKNREKQRLWWSQICVCSIRRSSIHLYFILHSIQFHCILLLNTALCQWTPKFMSVECGQ